MEGHGECCGNWAQRRRRQWKVKGTAMSKKGKDIQAWYSGLVGDPQVSDVYLIPYQEAPVCEVG